MLSSPTPSALARSDFLKFFNIPITSIVHLDDNGDDNNDYDNSDGGGDATTSRNSASPTASVIVESDDDGDVETGAGINAPGIVVDETFRVRGGTGRGASGRVTAGGRGVAGRGAMGRGAAGRGATPRIQPVGLKRNNMRSEARVVANARVTAGRSSPSAERRAVASSSTRVSNTKTTSSRAITSGDTSGGTKPSTCPKQRVEPIKRRTPERQRAQKVIQVDSDASSSDETAPESSPDRAREKRSRHKKGKRVVSCVRVGRYDYAVV